MKFSKAATDFAINVHVPYHITQATLVDPNRLALSIFIWVIGDQEEKTFSYEIIDDGWTLIIRYGVPDMFTNKDKLFPEKRLRGEHRVWQGHFLNSMSEFAEENNLENGFQLTYQQKIDLPIQVHSNKEHDDVFYVDLGGLYVRNIMLRGTKVFGSGDEKNVKESSFFEESSEGEQFGYYDDESSDDDDL